MAKRPRETYETGATITTTPKKLRFDNAATPTKTQQTTPSKRGRKSKVDVEGVSSPSATPTGRKTLQSAKCSAGPTFATPTKSSRSKEGNTITVNPNADQSAKRKANRNLIQRTIGGNGSEDEEDDLLVNQIWDEEHGEVDSETDPDDLDLSKAAEQLPETPSKRGRGRPKGSKNRRTPTPPPNIPPHERYFFHNRSSAAKSSSNTVSSQTLLSHAEYHELVSKFEDPHASSITELHELHTGSFPLWAFELSQGYTVCLYGYGSKRKLLTSFADYLHAHPTPRPPQTLIINGHHPSLSIRSILQTIANALGISTGASATPATLLPAIISHQSRAGSSATPVYLLISTLHAKPLTTSSASNVLSTLAALPSICLVLTASNPSFPLLWPSSMRDSLNILFHDATTFLSYDDPSSSISELGIGVVDSVAELMGRKGPAAAGRERVRWVLKSLPENAKGLYRILVSEILASDADGIGMNEDEDDDMGVGKADETVGIDSKVLYQKASEEFLCSSEMAFRGLLREFVDHAMISIRREGGSIGGGEVLGIDMGKEELEDVLEDLLT